MKNTRKFLVFFLVVILFGLTSCGKNSGYKQTGFCSEEQYVEIKNGLINKINDGSIDEAYIPTYEKLDKSGVITSLVNDGKIDASSKETVTWDFIVSLDDANKYEDQYANYLWQNVYPKACLVMDDNHIDEISGVELERKTFGDAFKLGLFSMLCYPISWLFVKGANLLGGGNITGISIVCSIVLVTFLIRAFVLLLTIKSTKQQQIIQAMQPQLNAINAKYANKNDNYSKQAKAQEMMNLYSKYNVNPASSLIAPLITLPIFISVYNAIRYTTVIFEQTLANVSLRSNLGGLIIKGNWFAILVFVIMAGTQFVTMKLPQWLAKKNMKSYKRESASNPGNGMTYFFLAMIVIVSWSLPIAMSIYWVASSVFSILQSYIFRPKKGRKNYA